MCMHMSQCLCVCVPSLPDSMPHTCIAIWYVQVYCVHECVRMCHYDDVQVHVCNNASVYTSVSQHERMHVHVNCKQIIARNHCNRSRVGEAGIRQEFLATANWKALYTNRGLCECVANSLTRTVSNTAMGGARLLQHWNPLLWYDRLAK